MNINESNSQENLTEKFMNRLSEQIAISRYRFEEDWTAMANMKGKQCCTSMFKAKTSTSKNQGHGSSNSSAISGTSSANEERSMPETKLRWKPKPEQLTILISRFDSGMMKPSREEIKRIRAQLQEFGQVEEANVSSWFQNRKFRRQRHEHHLQPAESSKSGTEKNTTDSLHNTGESYSSYVPADPFSKNQEYFNVQMNEEMNNDQCSYMQAAAAAQVFNEGTCENFRYEKSISVFINGMIVEVPVGPINVSAVFGEIAVLHHSTGEPVLVNEWGFTLECLQEGYSYKV